MSISGPLGVKLKLLVIIFLETKDKASLQNNLEANGAVLGFPGILWTAIHTSLSHKCLELDVIHFSVPFNASESKLLVSPFRLPYKPLII